VPATGTYTPTGTYTAAEEAYPILPYGTLMPVNP
jgi:hypothetical protein